MTVVWLSLLMGGMIVAWWFYTRRPDRQFAHIASQLRRITMRRHGDAVTGRRLMRQLYKLLRSSVIAGKADDAYRAFDMLKLALGHNLGQAGEPVRISSVIYLAIKSDQPDTAGHGIDSFRPLLKNIAIIEIPAAIEQLGLIAIISLKQRQNFLAARAVDVIFSSLPIAADDNIHVAVMRVVKLIGLTALRRGDDGLIREIQAKLAGYLAAEPDDSAAHELAAGVLTAWLLQCVKAGDAGLIELLDEYIRHLADKKILPETALASIIAECSHIAGMDCLNPYSQVAGVVSMLSLYLALQVKSNDTWRQAVDGAGQAARLAASQRSLAESFAVFYPLFESGRRLLTDELNSGSLCNLFREQALYIVIRECLQLIEFVSRQNFTTTTADVIDQLYQDWSKRYDSKGQQKSIKKFCQLLFLYGKRLSRRQKRLSADGTRFNATDVITVANRERLTQLGYLS